MKKMFAMLTCLGLCGVMLAGCSRNDGNSGSTSSGVTATTTSKNEVTSRRDDSDTLVSRVGDGIKDTVSGGADIIDDTVSSVESVVDDIIRQAAHMLADCSAVILFRLAAVRFLL